MIDNDLTNWNKLAEDYHKLISGGDFLKIHALDGVILDLLHDPKNKKILDAGCGQGYMAKKISDLGGNVIGVDGAEELIKIAKNTFKESQFLKFSEGDLRNPLPFKSGEFDIVLANMALMDFDPINPAIKEFSRILKNQGIFIFSIIHPLMRGKLKKNLLEKILFKPPHLEISDYKTSIRKRWRINKLPIETNVYHRPLENYVQLLKENNFYIKDIREKVLNKELVKNKNNFLKFCAEIPHFLVIKAVLFRDLPVV